MTSRFALGALRVDRPHDRRPPAALPEPGMLALIGAVPSAVFGRQSRPRA